MMTKERQKKLEDEKRGTKPWKEKTTGRGKDMHRR